MCKTVTSSTKDKRVPCWGVMKYIAKLRSIAPSNPNPLLLMLDEELGHIGECGRYSCISLQAEELSFLVNEINDIGRTSNNDSPTSTPSSSSSQ